MSRFLIRKENGSYLEEIESMELCKWLINDICCNEKSDCLGGYPYSRSICEDEYGCGCFEKEDGVIKEEL